MRLYLAPFHMCRSMSFNHSNMSGDNKNFMVSVGVAAIVVGVGILYQQDTLPRTITNSVRVHLSVKMQRAQLGCLQTIADSTL